MTKTSEHKKIGVFGGTFNPPHLGHLKLVSDFADKLSLSDVLIIPTYTPPHKQADGLVSSEHRLRMCSLTFERDKRFHVCDIEIKREGKSYTFDTLTALSELYPSAHFYLIIGSDMLLSFDEWHRYKDVLNLCTICAAERDTTNNPLKKHGIPSLFKGHNLIVLDFKPLSVTSSLIRKMIKTHQDISPFVAQEVIQYIADNNLYL
ncbi:MAG TPA: nicotinate (nicotinamide) nucleotide adenylyltransferase [Clostridia bacterium]|nr:nicotinate (nicotinamide) nucleotide adenylyltransferase [Clostridia bacterium]